jgi:hypothetical protein
VEWKEGERKRKRGERKGSGVEGEWNRKRKGKRNGKYRYRR